MRIKIDKTPDKHVRVSFETWQKLRTAAYYQDKCIKTIFEEIAQGKINPVTMETISAEN
jgi:hypothetical protein